MILAVFNPKGGVGKTTTAVNISSVLAAQGKSVLLVDLEADLNASISLGIRPANARPSIADVLVHDARPTDAVRGIRGLENLYLITGSPSLTQMDGLLRNVRQPERRLSDALRPLAREFEYVILDTPAGFSTLGLSVPLAVAELIVPLPPEYLALESLAQFLRWYRDRRTARKGLAHISGILLTKVDYRAPATREIVDIIRLHNRQGVFRVEIPLDPRAAEAPSHGVPLVHYSRSRAATAYERLTDELLKRLPRRK